MPRIPTPLRLTGEDFDAFVEGSPAVRVRLELAPRMLRWARGVARRLEDHGIGVRAVVPGFGAGPRRGKSQPTQRVLLQEDPGTADETADASVRLSLSVDGAKVEVALEVPADTKAFVLRLREALEEEGWRAELLAALEALPEAFVFECKGEPGGQASAATDPAAWLSLLARCVLSGRSSKILWTLPRDVAITHSSVLDVELEDGILALVPLYKLVAHPGAEPRRGKARAKIGTKQAPRRTAAPGGRNEAETPPPFERGARVRVLAGPFAGKVGVVKEVDATKGRAHVMLGLLATRIDVKDLASNHAGGRPTLSSSHRKPLGLR